MPGIFRYIWRVNAVVILVAASAVSAAALTGLWWQIRSNVSRSREVDASPSLGRTEPGASLVLGRLSLVEGTNVLRGQLQRGLGKDYSMSSGSSETRNILFVDNQSGSATWLLPDDDHVIIQQQDIVRQTDSPLSRRPVATVALVKPAVNNLSFAEGRLLLFEPSGGNVRIISEGVRELHSAALNGGGIAILFERRQKYVLASFDTAGLVKKEEHELVVPELK